MTRDEMNAMGDERSETPLIRASWPTPSCGWPVAIASVPYSGAAGPTSGVPGSWLEGSNCQRFVSGVLALYGLLCPPLRSSNLWDDHRSTTVVEHPEPL